MSGSAKRIGRLLFSDLPIFGFFYPLDLIFKHRIYIAGLVISSLNVWPINRIRCYLIQAHHLIIFVFNDLAMPDVTMPAVRVEWEGSICWSSTKCNWQVLTSLKSCIITINDSQSVERFNSGAFNLNIKQGNNSIGEKT